jgi:hypothetical protein
LEKKERKEKKVDPGSLTGSTGSCLVPGSLTRDAALVSPLVAILILIAFPGVVGHDESNLAAQLLPVAFHADGVTGAYRFNGLVLSLA